MMPDDVAGGPHEWTQSQARVPGQLKLGNCIRLAVFVLLALLPLA